MRDYGFDVWAAKLLGYQEGWRRLDKKLPLSEQFKPSVCLNDMRLVVMAVIEKGLGGKYAIALEVDSGIEILEIGDGYMSPDSINYDEVAKLATASPKQHKAAIESIKELIEEEAGK